MERDVQTCAPSDCVVTVARMMRDRSIGLVPVCTPEGQVLGVITDRDLAVRALAADCVPRALLAEVVMSRGVVACQASDPIDVAEELMARFQKGRILCLDAAGRLVGVISLTDLAAVDSGDRVFRVFKAIADREAVFVLI